MLMNGVQNSCNRRLAYTKKKYFIKKRAYHLHFPVFLMVDTAMT